MIIVKELLPDNSVKKNPLRGDDKRVQTRFQYRPDIIKFLFVCESVPNNGTFFYHKDSILFNHSLEAFKKVFPKINPANFLSNFKAMGFYLDDLCSEPVNQYKSGKDVKKRKTLRILYEEDLAKRIELFKPELIFVTPKDIMPNVVRILEKLKMKIEIVELPFPVYNYGDAFIKILNDKLVELKTKHKLLIE